MQCTAVHLCALIDRLWSDIVSLLVDCGIYTPSIGRIQQNMHTPRLSGASARTISVVDVLIVVQGTTNLETELLQFVSTWKLNRTRNMACAASRDAPFPSCGVPRTDTVIGPGNASPANLDGAQCPPRGGHRATHAMPRMLMPCPSYIAIPGPGTSTAYTSSSSSKRPSLVRRFAFCPPCLGIPRPSYCFSFSRAKLSGMNCCGASSSATLSPHGADARCETGYVRSHQPRSACCSLLPSADAARVGTQRDPKPWMISDLPSPWEVP